MDVAINVKTGNGICVPVKTGDAVCVTVETCRCQAGWDTMMAEVGGLPKEAFMFLFVGRSVCPSVGLSVRLSLR